MNDAPSPAEALFLAAAEIAEPQERTAFLTRECGGDRALRERVEGLLTSHEEAGDFLEISAPSPEVEAEFARVKPEEAGERIGNYKLLEQIGEGGFGTVWVAEQERPVRRRVALKIIKLGMDTKEVIARFEQERQALALMDHPNIAKVHDAGATQYGRPFLVMELVHGIKITNYCDQANLPTAQRLELFVQVCCAVQHAHQKGIIHRDLKPSNILVTLHDGVPVPKVIDFGVAKATQGRLGDLSIYTQFQQMVGTPLYMSPEQAEMSGLDVDTRTDIYSLGVLLYELLTGRTPFAPEELMKVGYDQMRRVIREQEPRKPSTCLSTMAVEMRVSVAQHRQSDGSKLVGLIRGDLDWIVMKALEKDRTRRYETAVGLGRDIERHLGNEAVLARPPSTTYKIGRFAQRNKGAVAAAIAMAALLVAGTGVSIWQALRAIHAEDAAKKRATDAEIARQDAEAISKFLTQVFESPDPARDGRTITVAETLDRAVKKLDRELASQPERKARLQHVLARTYMALGLVNEAVPLGEKVLGLTRKLFGPEHPETLSAMNSLAASYSNAGRLEEALTMHEEVLALCRKVLGPEHPDTLTSMSHLSASYMKAGRHEEALKLQEGELALTLKVFGPEHLETWRAMHNLTVLYWDAGRRDEAMKMTEEVLANGKKVLGPEHPQTLTSKSNLAGFYFDAGRRDEALTIFEEVLSLRRKVLGPEHPDTLDAMNRLATSYSDAGRLVEALTMHEEVLTLRRKVLGPKHPDTIASLKTTASSLEKAGRPAEAAKLREEARAEKQE